MRERERHFMCERESKSESVCVCERERESLWKKEKNRAIVRANEREI